MKLKSLFIGKTLALALSLTLLGSASAFADSASQGTSHKLEAQLMQTVTKSFVLILLKVILATSKMKMESISSKF